MAEINIQELNDSLIEIKTMLKSNKDMEELKAKNEELERKVLTEKIKVVNHRIEDLEKNQSWLIKGVIGSVLSAIGGFIYVSK